MRREGVVVAIILLILGAAGVGFVLGGSQASPPTTTTFTSASTVTSVSTTTVTISATLYATRTLDNAGASGQLGPWDSTGSLFPGTHQPSDCVIAGGYIYCVGGNGNATYYAAASAGRVGQWTRGSDYPTPIDGGSCVTSANYIYCVGGISTGHGNQTVDKYGRTSAAYYTQITALGVVQWVKTTSYPYLAAFPRCVSDSAYIYCVENAFNGTAYSVAAEAYYAPLSASGIGTWVQTNAPATTTADCLAVGGYAYCFGGGQCPPYPGDCYSPSYSTILSPSGFAKWNKTMDIPTAVFATAVAAGSYIFELNVPIFYAHVANGAIGPWRTTTNFPSQQPGEYPGPCASDGAFIYCEKVNTGVFYSSQVGAPNPSALVLLNPPPFPRSDYLVPAWNGAGGCGVSGPWGFSGAPCFGANIDDAVIFDCAAEANTTSGCSTTVVSPSNIAYNYGVTIWYPKYNASFPQTNCMFMPSHGYSQPFHAWCISISNGSFIMAQPVTMKNSPP